MWEPVEKPDRIARRLPSTCKTGLSRPIAAVRTKHGFGEYLLITTLAAAWWGVYGL